MVVPPDSNTPPTTSTAAQPDDNIGSPGAPIQEQLPHVDIFVADEADRSWLSRLRSMKTPWAKPHPRKSAHDEPVTTHASRNSEHGAASLAALRDVCASIDQRLARFEELSGQRELARIDEALHDLYSQTYERLARIEAAVQRSEAAVADRTLHELCRNIDARVERTEDALHRNESAIAEGFHRSEGAMAEGFQRSEGAVANAFHRSEGAVAEGLRELSGHVTARFEGVDEALRLTPKSVADRMLPNIERQLMQARMALHRAEEAMTDKTLHELCQNINARLQRSEDTLHRKEDVVAEGLDQLSTRMTARFAEVEDTIQRLERTVSSRTVEQIAYPQPSAQVSDHPARATETAPPRRWPLSRFVNIKRPNRPIRLPWMAGLVVPVVVLVAAFAIAALIKTSLGVAPEKVAPLATSDQIAAPVIPPTNAEVPTPAATAVMANGLRSTRESPVSTPQPRSPDRAPVTTGPRPARFVGTLSITSVPSGALVSINGKPAGKTPLRLPRQRAGSLAVQVAHEGFERWSAAVLVPADQLTHVTARLRATAR